LAACTLLSGVGDLVEGEATPDAAEALAPVPTTTGTVTPPAPIDSGKEDPDGNVLGDIDAAIVDACSPTGCSTLPPNFTLVALGAKNAACPAGFGQPLDVIETPSLDPGACSCGCSTLTSPTCAPAAGAMLDLFVGFTLGLSCPSNVDQINIGCASDGVMGPFNSAGERRYDPPPASPSGGTCKGTAQKDSAKLKAVDVRICQATVIPQCDGKACTPNTGAFKACIASNGNIATCPPEFPERHLTGTSASFTCAETCSCGVNATCPASGKLSYFTNATCAGAPGVTFIANDACNPTGNAGGPYLSHRYDPDPPNVGPCSAGGSPAASAPTLAQQTTVCCK